MNLQTLTPGIEGLRLAYVVVVLAILLAWETARPFFPFFKGSWTARGVHILRNFGVAVLNAVIIGFCFAYAWEKSAGWSNAAGFGVLNLWELPVWMHACLAILLLDLWTYWWHWANHHIPWLWRFHRMHHSDPWMDVSSGRRFHPGEIMISSLLRIPLIVLLGIQLKELVLYVLVQGIVVDFHHANIALPEPLDRFLRIWIVTPAMHKVHHSCIRIETDSNYTSLLSLWDRLFGTFRLRLDPSGIKLGLDGWSEAPHQTMRGMLATPLHGLKPAADI